MANTFKLGSLDLSSYIRLAPGDGYQPGGGGGWLEPGFQDSPLSEGQTLAGVSANNRELAIPLYLKAASKDALFNLVESINNQLQIANTQVEWKDDQATNSTFYTLQFGRLEDDFNFRRAQHNILAAVCRLFVAPYGSTGTNRIVATATATAPIGIVSVPSALDGDAPAQLTVTARMGSTVPYGGRAVALSAIAHPSYAANFSAASLTGGTLSGEPYAPASQVRTFYSGDGFTGRDTLGIPLPIPSVYAGYNRVYGLVRDRYAATLDGAQLTTFDPDENVCGPTAVASGNGRDWQLLELGAFSIASNYAGPSSYVLQVRIGNLYDIQIANVMVLPDKTTVYALDTPFKYAVGAQGLGNSDQNALAQGSSNVGASLWGTNDSLGNTWALDPFGKSGNDAAASVMGFAFSQQSFVGPPYDPVDLNLNIGDTADSDVWVAATQNVFTGAVLNTSSLNQPRVMTRALMGAYGTIAASGMIALRLMDAAANELIENSYGQGPYPNVVEARLSHANSTQLALSLYLLGANSAADTSTSAIGYATLLASRGIDMPRASVYTPFPMDLDLFVAPNNQITARLIPGAYATSISGGRAPTVLTSGGTAFAYASIGASYALNSPSLYWSSELMAGIVHYRNASVVITATDPFIYGTVGTAAAGILGFNQFTVDEVTATRALPNDLYTFDGVNNSLIRSASGGDVTANLTPNQRGRFPNALPSTAQIAFMAAPLYIPNAETDAIAITVAARERFRFAR